MDRLGRAGAPVDNLLQPGGDIGVWLLLLLILQLKCVALNLLIETCLFVSACESEARQARHVATPWCRNVV